MTPKQMTRVNMALAAVSGLALRLYLVLKFPVTDTGDGPFYIELAWNWLKNGVFGFAVHGQLTPVDMRVPGYPAFLAAVFAVAGQSPRAAMLAQVVVDLATCFVIALIAARLTPEDSRRRVALAGLWLAALCPFTANYTAVVLTETLVIFLTALAILVLLQTDVGGAHVARATAFLANPWLLAGIVVGFGILVGPETPVVFFWGGVGVSDLCPTQRKVKEEEIAIDELPAYAFDSQDEKERMADLLEEYNEALTIDPPLDRGFREIARERTARHPLRTYVKVPLLRTLTLWFTPRAGWLPFSGLVCPVRTRGGEQRAH